LVGFPSAFKTILFKTKFTSLKPNIHPIILFLLFLMLGSLSAKTSYFFYVQLANKNNSPYTFSNPSAYLSERAITRRAFFGIECDSTDLPISPSYISQIKSVGVNIHCRNKWINGVTVVVSDTSIIKQVRTLPFVKWVQYTGKRDAALPVSAKVNAETTTLNYGSATAQVNQINGSYFHNAGYTGKDIVIGVLDAGFTNVNTNHAFDSLRFQGRLLGTKDIAEPNSNIYSLDDHGANVLSIMTGNLPGKYLGAAPKASYWLIRTEYSPTEYLVETDFWASGIEFADSVGVDVINSSLVYTEFDDPGMDFTYNDMNGKVSRASRAASLASKKGIIVCNSAGNYGSSMWQYLGSPADADGIITVGSVTSTGSPSDFSSYGPSSDGRVKPEICALGTSTAFVNKNGSVSTGNGTSYSSPVIAGTVACLVQALKETNSHFDVESIRTLLIQSSNMYYNPTDQLGYGIPDFDKLLKYLNFYDSKKAEASSFEPSYDAYDKTIHIVMFNNSETTDKIVRIYSITGCKMLEKTIMGTITILPVNRFPTGIYMVSIFSNGKMDSKKIIVQ
jgi:serine protease AprX